MRVSFSFLKMIIGAGSTGTNWCLYIFLMGQPRPLFNLFSVFSNNSKMFTTNKMWKMNNMVFGSGIWTHDLLIINLLP